MFSIFTHVMKPVRDTNSEPGLPVIPFSGFRSWWCNIRPSLLYLVHVLLIDNFRAQRGYFSLRNLSTNWEYPHSQNATRNYFRGPSRQALPLPSRVSRSCARSSSRPLLPSACYAGRLSWIWHPDV